MLEKAVQWIKNNSIPGQGIVVSSRQRVSYPEVTGYFIPTLLSIGERELAYQYARWLLSVQRQDGSYGLNGHSYAFDTGQVVRGWVALLEQMPELEQPLCRACDWLIETTDSQTGRLMVPPSGAAWSLGRRGQVSEGIHLHVLPPLYRAGELLNESRYCEFVSRSLNYYLKNVNLTDFSQPNALTHFYAYAQEALLELGCEDEARRGMASVAGYQQQGGAVPGYSDVSWVCSTGLAQLAQVWYRLGETERADAALKFLEMVQNPSGGFFGSYGVGADYFPAEEISWACKYAIEAAQQQIAGHFNQTVDIYQADIAETDGRVQAVLSHLGDLNGKRVLDAGCGKGRFSAIIKRRYPQADVTALDISARMLRHVPPGIRTVQGGILDMPFADGRFDAVICIEALEHVVQIAEGVKELTRVLAPGGKLIIIDKNKDKLGALKMPSWEKWFGREELLGIMQANGLEADAEFIGYDNMTEPDGLFVCWRGQKIGLKADTAPSLSLNSADESGYNVSACRGGSKGNSKLCESTSRVGKARSIRVLFNGSCWPTNIGNAFVNLGAIHSLKSALGKDGNVFHVGGMPAYLFGTKGKMHNALPFGEIVDCDYLVHAGMTMCAEHLVATVPIYQQYAKRGTKIIFAGGGAGKYTDEEVNMVREAMKKFPVYALISRDCYTLEKYGDLVQHGYNGIDSALFISDCFEPVPFNLPQFNIMCFDSIEEPPIDHDGRLVVRTHHSCWPTYSKPAYFEHPDTLISDLPSDYLSLYAQVSTVYSDRVHACIPALAFGNQAVFFGKNSPRMRMFERIGASDIFKMPVKLDMEQLRKGKEKQVEFLRTIIVGRDENRREMRAC